MNRNTYNLIIGIPLVLFIVCSPDFIEFIIEKLSLNNLLGLDRAFTNVFNLVRTALATTLLLFGLYFRKSVIIQGLDVIMPRLAIGFGVAFILMIFIPATSSYFMLRKINTENYVFTEELLVKWKESALSDNCNVNNNRLIAAMFYNETGEALNYKSETGEIILFTPNNDENEKRDLEIKIEQEHQEVVKASYNLYYFRLLVVVICIIVWLLVKKTYPPERIIIS